MRIRQTWNKGARCASYSLLVTRLFGQKLKELEETGGWKRGDYVETQGWATMPGEEEPDSQVADECAKMLMLINK